MYVMCYCSSYCVMCSYSSVYSLEVVVRHTVCSFPNFVTHFTPPCLDKLVLFIFPTFYYEGGGCNPKKPNATANFKFGTVFFSVFFLFFSVFSILANFDWFNGFSLSGSYWLK